MKDKYNQTVRNPKQRSCPSCGIIMRIADVHKDLWKHYCHGHRCSGRRHTYHQWQYEDKQLITSEFDKPYNTMSEKYEVTKDRILDAASKCSTAKDTLKVLFPEAFEKELDLTPLKSVTRNDNAKGGISLTVPSGTEIARILKCVSARVCTPMDKISDTKQEGLIAKGAHYISLYNNGGKWAIDRVSDTTHRLVFVPTDQLKQDKFY